MISTNHKIIQYGINSISTTEKNNISEFFLSSISSDFQAQKFYNSVKFPGNDVGGKQMYPKFYIPPYNGGKKLKTVLNQTPKAHIFSANMHELEILRLLFLLSPNELKVKNMVESTLKRLKTTCFASENDGVGECFDTNLVVIRFLATVATNRADWINERINSFKSHFYDKKRPSFVIWYYWLCLSELPFSIAEDEIGKYKDEILNWLEHKSCVMNSDSDKRMHPVLLCILRNIMCRFNEYNYIKGRQPFINPANNRLIFNMAKS